MAKITRQLQRQQLPRHGSWHSLTRSLFMSTPPSHCLHLRQRQSPSNEPSRCLSQQRLSIDRESVLRAWPCRSWTHGKPPESDILTPIRICVRTSPFLPFLHRGWLRVCCVCLVKFFFLQFMLKLSAFHSPSSTVYLQQTWLPCESRSLPCQRTGELHPDNLGLLTILLAASLAHQKPDSRAPETQRPANLLTAAASNKSATRNQPYTSPPRHP